MNRPRVLLLSLVTAMVAAIAVAGSAPGASSTTITFDELAEGTAVRDQYAERGVRFGGDEDFDVNLSGAFACGPPTVLTSAPDDIERKAAEAPRCGGRSGTLAAFTNPQRQVSALVWESDGGRSAELRAYDSSEDLVARAGPAELGFDPVELSIDGDDAEIAYLALQLTGEGDESLVFDDLTFEGGAEELLASGRDFTATAGAEVRAVVAHFTDSTKSGASDYAARIDWGDGRTADGSIAASGDGYDVSGSHTYATAGTYTISTRIQKANGVEATARSSAQVRPAAAAPDFLLALAPPSVKVSQGQSATFTVTVSPLAGFSGAVSLSLAGAAGSFSPQTVSGVGTSTLTVTTSAETTPGTYPLTVTGQSGALVRTAGASLEVTAAPHAPSTGARAIFVVSPRPARRLAGGFLLDASASRPSSGRKIVLFEWDFNGDGRTDVACGGNAPLAAYAYTAAGRHRIRLRVSDSHGAAASAAQSIDVPRSRLLPKTAESALCSDAGTDQLPNTGDDCVRTFTVGPVEAVSRRACFTVVQTGSSYRATIPGPYGLNGLVVPLPNTVTSTFNSNGDLGLGRRSVRFGPHELPALNLNVHVPPAAGTFRLASVNLQKALKVAGLPLRGMVTLDLQRARIGRHDLRTTKIVGNLGLPFLFTDRGGNGLTGELKGRVWNYLPFQLEAFSLSIPHVFIGGFEVQGAFLDYKREEGRDVWHGGGGLFLPPSGGVRADIRIAGGNFSWFKGQFNPPTPIPIGPGTFLRHIRFVLELEPELALEGGVGIGVGPDIPVPGGTCPAALVDGGFRLTLRPELTYRAGGTVSLACLNLAEGYYILRPLSGTAEIGGRIGFEVGLCRDCPKILGLTAFVRSGIAVSSTNFQIYSVGRFCIRVLVGGCVEAEVVVSDRGVGVCGDFGFTHAGGGFFFPFYSLTPPIPRKVILFADSCDITRFETPNLPRPRLSSGSGTGGLRLAPFRLSSGLPVALVAVRGTTTAPFVTLEGPGGRRIATPRAGSVRTKTYMLFRNPSDKTTYIFVGKPSGGRWVVRTQPGSAPIAKLFKANGLPRPQVDARVEGSGYARKLVYRIRPLPGQTVRFTEHGQHLVRDLGRARGLRGTIRFAPADGPAGTRRIVAGVARNGLPRTNLTVATYTAPGPLLPAKPGKLRVRRAGTGLLATWGPSARAVRYAVTISLSDGRRLLLLPIRPAIRVPAVGRTVTGTIRVAGLRADNREGPAATARLQPTRKPR